MSPHDKTDADGAQSDGVPYKSATDKLSIYAEVRQQLASFQEPVLLHGCPESTGLHRPVTSSWKCPAAKRTGCPTPTTPSRATRR